MKRLTTVLLLLTATASAASLPGRHFLLKPWGPPKPYATPAMANNQDIPHTGGTRPGQTVWRPTYTGKT